LHTHFLKQIPRFAAQAVFLFARRAWQFVLKAFFCEWCVLAALKRRRFNIPVLRRLRRLRDVADVAP
jgi:hypothetical protein